MQIIQIIFLCLFIPVQLISQKKDSIKKIDNSKKATYDSIAGILYKVDSTDQKYRNLLDGVAAKYGGDSKQMDSLLKSMRTADSLNIETVSSIIDKFGWLGPDKIGLNGTQTLFRVVQHAKLDEQLKYLPVMTEASKKGSLKPASLALLIDRVALRQGKKQIYGTQVAWNMKTGAYYVLPLEDPDKVDLRRAEMGLGSITIYIKTCCNLDWNIEKSKTDSSHR